MITLNENERLDDLLIDGLKIIQDVSLYRFSSDSILLSKFAEYKKGEKVADFCSGSGIVGLHFYALHQDVSSIDFFEIQKELSNLCERSIEYNGLKEKLTAYNMPLQEIGDEYNNKYGLILCNPPYKKANSGERNLTEDIAICRHEIKITLQEIIKISADKLKFKGRLCMCQRTERLTDTLYEMRRNGIEPCKLQFVSASNGKKPYLFLVEGVKGVKPQLKVLENSVN